MRLKSRIKRLKEQNREVNLHHYSIVNFDGYNAQEAATRFWAGAALFVFFVFILFIVGNWIYTAQISGTNPELVRAQMQKDAKQNDDFRKEKQQYIDGCKSAGKMPGNMGNLASDWECK